MVRLPSITHGSLNKLVPPSIIKKKSFSLVGAHSDSEGNGSDIDRDDIDRDVSPGDNDEAHDCHSPATELQT